MTLSVDTLIIIFQIISKLCQRFNSRHTQAQQRANSRRMKMGCKHSVYDKTYDTPSKVFECVYVWQEDTVQ